MTQEMMMSGHHDDEKRTTLMMIGLKETGGLHNGRAGHLAEPGADGAAAPYGPQIHALIIPRLTSQRAF